MCSCLKYSGTCSIQEQRSNTNRDVFIVTGMLTLLVNLELWTQVEMATFEIGKFTYGVCVGLHCS